MKKFTLYPPLSGNMSIHLLVVADLEQTWIYSMDIVCGFAACR